MHSCFYVTHAYNNSRLWCLVNLFHAGVEYFESKLYYILLTHGTGILIEFVLQYLE